jgi:hypothetical protein
LPAELPHIPAVFASVHPEDVVPTSKQIGKFTPKPGYPARGLPNSISLLLGVEFNNGVGSARELD